MSDTRCAVVSGNFHESRDSFDNFPQARANENVFPFVATSSRYQMTLIECCARKMSRILDSTWRTGKITWRNVFLLAFLFLQSFFYNLIFNRPENMKILKTSELFQGR